MSDTLERRVECASGKLLFRVCSAGIKVWCQRHRAEHLYEWGQLEALRTSVSLPDMRVTLSDHTEALPGCGIVGA